MKTFWLVFLFVWIALFAGAELGLAMAEQGAQHGPGFIIAGISALILICWGMFELGREWK